MLIVGFAAGDFQTNTYLLATGEGSDCVIVDPGLSATEPVDEALHKHRLSPVAVLATHGHVDHVHSAAAVADGHGIPVYIQPGDRDLLSDPLKGLGPQLAAMFAGQFEMTEPQQVIALDGTPLVLAGLRIEVDHTPGHTPGSVIFRVTTDEGGLVALTGDTLFAGSIGRTDLPGGDMDQMQETLRSSVLTMPDSTVVLPGHGSTTTIGDERASNPFLSGITPASRPGS